MGKDEQRVVGAGVAVDAYGVESTAGDIAESLLEERRRNIGVSGDEGKRGGHVRMDHAGAFGAADEMDAFAGHAE
ncbi:MAG: hypothetical protein NVS9B14_24240 [Candidatus Acidiferrum sp.]